MSNDAPPEPWVRLRSVRAHPFVFQKMIREVDPRARPGDVVRVLDKGDHPIGRGLFNPRSQIVVRLLSTADQALDDAFWRERLRTALDLRRLLRIDEVTDAQRLVHAEGDRLSGLVVERYADVLVFELFSLGMFQRVARFADLLSELLGPPASLDRPGRPPAAWRRVVRADEQIERLEGFRVQQATEDANSVVIREHGVRYRVHPATGHKTGFFCDQRDNRAQFARFCRDARVLDLCCYSGGFGLAARVLGGAREVTGVDLDEQALQTAQENANLNQVRVEYAHADAFNYCRQMLANERRYDAVVLDPPKLATSRAEIEPALRKYHDLNSLAMQLVEPSGLFLTCSCSGLVSFDAFLAAVHSAARRAGRELQMIDATGAAGDHPVLLNCPESAYLKALWFRVLPRH
ncbi:MAG: class I SAM-dependent rRNA methyltransferase [Phycisphaerales bacterium]|nr:class I SAM-dependent rRNA methyltransferase [Phycisphaerales bacterium]